MGITVDLPGTEKLLQEDVKEQGWKQYEWRGQGARGQGAPWPWGVWDTAQGGSLRGTLQAGWFRESTEKEVLRVSW